MTLVTAILWALASLLVAGTSATAARSLDGLTRRELDDVCRRRGYEARAAEIAQSQRRVALACHCLAAVGSAVFLVSLVAGAIAVWQPTGLALNAEFAALAAIGSLALVVVTVGLPMAVSRVWGAAFACNTWPVWRSVDRLAAPLVFLARKFDVWMHRLVGRPSSALDEAAFDDELRASAPAADRDGDLENDAREMIEGVMQLGDAEVSEIMTPRTYMVSMQVTLSLDEAVKFVVQSGHTRIPVYDKNRDDIIGILHMKDLLPELLKPPGQRAATVSDLLRPAPFVPETKRLDALLEEFQHTRNHLAVVLDEYGGVSGVVTIEDVLEEIVGEIDDEYDDAMVDGIRTIDPRTSEALARVHIDEVNQRLGLHLPETGDFDTIGGLVFSHLGHIPLVGESVMIDEVRLTVVDVTRRRIERVRIEVLDPQRETA